MGRKQAAQITALQADNARLGAERDKALRERDLAYDFIGDRRRDTKLTDVARRDMADRWAKAMRLFGIDR